MYEVSRGSRGYVFTEVLHCYLQPKNVNGLATGEAVLEGGNEPLRKFGFIGSAFVGLLTPSNASLIWSTTPRGGCAITFNLFTASH